MYSAEEIAALKQLLDEPIYFFSDEGEMYFSEALLAAREQVLKPSSGEEIPKSATVQGQPPQPRQVQPQYMVGANKRNITIVMEYAQPDFTKSEEFKLLLKIMEAVGLTLQEVAVVNLLDVPDRDMSALWPVLAPRQLLYFTASEQDLQGASIEKYQPTVFNGISSLYSDSLTILLLDVPKKKQLWASLRLFSQQQSL